MSHKVDMPIYSEGSHLGPALDKDHSITGFVVREGSELGHLRRRSSLGSHHAGHSSWYVATGHLITAIIGAGVLGLPYAMSWLGWIAGPITLVIFFLITLWTGLMLSEVYMVKGVRHSRYKFAVQNIMGPKHSIILSLAQHGNMLLAAIGYQIAAADSMRYIASTICASKGNAQGECFADQTMMTIIFGGLQILMSQLPNLESAWWASAIGALMSLGYSLIAIGLGASEAHNGLGTLTGKPAPPVDKLFGIFSSLGHVAFAYCCAMVLIEVQDTLREPPAAVVSMKKTVPVALSTSFLLYAAVSVTGYLALGNDVPSSIVAGFPSTPIWVTLLANFMVLVHMISAYQLLSQPVFATTEDLLLKAVPKLDKIAGREWTVRIVYRSLYVAITSLIASALPFFGAFVGLIGAVTFWPMAVFYPIEMWKQVYSPRGLKLHVLNFTNVLMGIVALLATVSSVETIVMSASKFKPFSGGL